MIFNSLFNLIETDTDGVYKFICRIFRECNCELCLADSLYVFAMVKKFSKAKERDDEHFLKLFENKKGLLKMFCLLTGNGELNFFTNNEDVEYSQLSETAAGLACIYAECFSMSNIRNPEETFCRKAVTS